MLRKTMLASATGIVVLFAASLAQADDTRAVTTTSAGSERGYGYIFHDDPLNADQWGSTTAIIKVRHRGAHSTLIRPRVQFVSEMLKSVENL